MIYDKTPTGVNQGAESGESGITKTTYDGDQTVTINYEGSVPSGMDIRLAIIDVLKAQRGVENVKSVKLTGSAPSYAFDATLELTNGDSAVIDSGTVILVNGLVSPDSISDAMDKANEDSGFTPNGTIAVEGNEITLTYSADTDANNGPKLMTDLSHFLGGLYTSGAVTESVEFEGKTYTWKGDKLDKFIGNNSMPNRAYSRWATGASGSVSAGAIL